jgi:hypothetical protein
MLTQIEWWGGLIFVVGALTYRMVIGALEPQDEGIPWYRLQMHAFYLLPAVVLAGYFYPLERAALQYAYLTVLGASLVMVLVMLAQELMGDASEDETTHAQGPGDEREETTRATETGESGGWASVLGAVVLYSPVLVACGLGCAKAWPMVQGLV